MQSAYRLGLKIALAYVLWALIPEVRAYTNLVIETARESRAIKAQQQKLSAADLESIRIVPAGSIIPPPQRGHL